MINSEKMQHVLDLSKSFIEQFDAIYQHPQAEDTMQRVKKMQSLLDTVLSVRLSSGKSLSLQKKMDWFFTSGSDADTLFGNLKEAEMYDAFIDRVAFTNDVEDTLYRTGVLHHADYSHLFPIKTMEYPGYVFPPADLLRNTNVAKDCNEEDEIREYTDTLIKTFRDFGVDISITKVSRGPRITRFEVVPNRGVRVSAITSLYDEILIAFHLTQIRMECPKPGEATVIFEIPNQKAKYVFLRELIESDAFQKNDSKMLACIGKGEDEKPIVLDIRSMPHLLIGGGTGSGKSLCIHSILTSLLYKARPDELKLILIDPKWVEFNCYRDIPHLLMPIVNDGYEVVPILKQVIREMERRYELFAELSVRNISAYNEKVKQSSSPGESLPYIVIAIDELYDCVLQSDHILKEQLVYLAQRSRACGIHLIVATQCPDEESVPEEIKVNFSTRIAFELYSNEASQRILNEDDAEKLLGRGDMLISEAGRSNLIRVQGTYVSDNEIEAVAGFVKKQSPNKNVK